MKQLAFEQRYASEWAAFAAVVQPQPKRKPLKSAAKPDNAEHETKAKAETKPGEIEANTVATDLPRAYRRLCHQLAVARSRQYSPMLVNRLNQLALSGHRALYSKRPSPWGGMAEFLLAGFPRLLRQEWKLFLLASLLFYLPLLITAWVIQLQPEFVYSIMDYGTVADFESMYEPSADRVGNPRGADSDFFMFGYYIMNNIGIAFRTFASGLLFGIGAVFILLYNGLFIGAATGHIMQLGYHETFFSFVVGHGSFELTAITIAGAAGLKIGLALLIPRGLTRLAALRLAAGTAIKLVYGAFVMLLIAAFIEAFWSSISTVSPATKYQVGALLWALVAIYLGLAGRPSRQPVQG